MTLVLSSCRLGVWIRNFPATFVVSCAEGAMYGVATCSIKVAVHAITTCSYLAYVSSIASEKIDAALKA